MALSRPRSVAVSRRAPAALQKGVPPGDFPPDLVDIWVCAAFASPSCTVEAAVAAQRALELPVRMGLATGGAELVSRDLSGLDVVRMPELGVSRP